MATTPNIFDYIDYRHFLKDIFEVKRNAKAAFSARAFAKLAGLKTPGYLGLVIRGARNLSPQSVVAFGKALKLSPKEMMYFKALVMFNQTTIEIDKEYHFEQLQKLRPPLQAKGLEKSQYEYFRFHRFVVIREMVALPHFKEDYEWIGNQLMPAISASDAQYAIEMLLRLNLLTRNPEGKLLQKDSIVNTPKEVTSLEIMNLNRDILQMAKQALFTVTASERDFTTLTIPLTQKSLPQIKKILEDCRNQIVAVVNKGDMDFQDVFQINMQLYPVTRTLKTNPNK